MKNGQAQESHWSRSRKIKADYRAHSGGVGLAQSDGSGGVVGMTPVIQGHNNIHVDEHVILQYAGSIYIATDGGIVRFNPEDHPDQPGKHDFNRLNTPSLRNFLSTSIDRNNNGGDFITGNFDNGIVYIHPASGCQHSDWSNEEEKLRFAPFPAQSADQQIAYSFEPNNGFFQSKDGGKSFSQINVKVNVQNGQYVFHAAQKGRMMLIGTKTNQVNNQNIEVDTVYETKDDWVSTPTDLLKNELSGRGSPSAICYAGDNILVCVDRQVLQSSDDGTSWHTVYSAPGDIVAMCADPGNPHAVYFATNTRFQPGKIFHTLISDDATRGWEGRRVQELTGNIPGEVGCLALLSNGAGESPYLYVALNNRESNYFLGGPGVYEATKLNRNNTKWHLCGTMLPDAWIRDLQIIPADPGTGVLLAATWGRGCWLTIIIPHTLD